MNYPDDIIAGSNRNPSHPLSPWHIDDSDRIEQIAADIINGDHDYTVEDCVAEVIYEDDELLARYKQGLKDVALTAAAGYELHRVLSEAVDIAARRIWEKREGDDV